LIRNEVKPFEGSFVEALWSP